MRKIKFAPYIVLLNVLIVVSMSGQDARSNEKIVVYEGNELVTINAADKQKNILGSDLWPQANDLKTDNIVYKASEIGMDIDADHLFVTGLRSIQQPDIWYCAIKAIFENSVQLVKYNRITKVSTSILGAKEGPEKDLSFLPIAIGNNPNTIYLEGSNYNTFDEYLGIWEYNLTTGRFKKLRLRKNYMTTPLISRDRKRFVYTAASKESRDVVHGVADLIIEYDLATDTETILYNSNGNQMRLMGFSAAKKAMPTISIDDYHKQRKSVMQETYYLPFTDQSAWCVTRDGTPRPPVSPLNSNNGLCTYSFGQHTYEALDFANSRTAGTSQDDTRAAAGGMVITARDVGCNCSYGNLVRILHDDGSISYYAHLTTIAVLEGDCIGQGELVGTEGATGDECCTQTFGEHAHFEVRASDASGTQIWIPFAEYGITPRQSDYVVSGNVPKTCCQSQLTITGNIPNGLQQASVSITSTGIVNNGISATFESPAIDLLPGFDGKAGSVFDGKNGGCQ